MLSVAALAVTYVVATPVAPTPVGLTTEVAAAYVKLGNRTTGKFIDGMGRTTNGAAAGQYSSSSSNNQQWTIEAAGDYVRIKNRATGLYLDGMGRTTGGTVVDSAASTRASPEFYQTYSLRNLSAGTHTVEIMVRSGSLVVDAVGVVRP